MKDLINQLQMHLSHAESTIFDIEDKIGEGYTKLDIKDLVYNLQYGLPEEQCKLDELIEELRLCNLIP